MSGYLQAGLALFAAIGLHVGGFALRPAPLGAIASGASGAELVSLHAADGSIADLVADWDRPPDLPAELAAGLVAPKAHDTPPNLPAASDATPLAALPDMALDRPLTDAAPKADVTLPVPTARPKARPMEKKATAEPVKKPKAPAQTGQKAAGAGKGAHAGEGGTAKAATQSQAKVNDLKAEWGASIRASIERRKRYPAGAKGASGKVTVRLNVTRAGGLTGVSVARSSGHAALDQAAIAAVRAAGAFPAAPKGLTDASYSFTLPMSFSK